MLNIDDNMIFIFGDSIIFIFELDFIKFDLILSGLCCSDGVGGSAVCAYRMKDILNTMSQDIYWKPREGQTEIKTGYVGNGVHQPGECVTETRDLTQSR